MVFDSQVYRSRMITRLQLESVPLEALWNDPELILNYRWEQKHGERAYLELILHDRIFRTQGVPVHHNPEEVANNILAEEAQSLRQYAGRHIRIKGFYLRRENAEKSWEL